MERQNLTVYLIKGEGAVDWDLGRENRSKGRAYGELSWISCILFGTSNQRGLVLWAHFSKPVPDNR